MDQRIKIAIACASGGGIGSLVALELSPLLWWIGLLVGASIGYISYDFKRILQAIPMAFRAACKIDTRPFFKGLSYFGSAYIFSSLLLFSWIFPLFVFSPGISLSEFVISAALFSCMFGLVFIPIIDNQRKRNERYFFAFYSPMVFFYYLPKWLVKMALATPTISRIVKEFFWQFFVRIHSDIRLLCAIDSTIGACIGYIAGSAIIGAVAGLLVGLFNYEIISKRILRVVAVPINRETDR